MGIITSFNLLWWAIVLGGGSLVLMAVVQLFGIFGGAAKAKREATILRKLEEEAARTPPSV